MDGAATTLRNISLSDSGRRDNNMRTATTDRERGATTATSATTTADGLTCECGRKFTRIENLRRHQRTHQNSRRLACPVCKRAFNRPDVLKRHLRTHDSTPPAEPVGESSAASRAASPSPERAPPHQPQQPPEPLYDFATTLDPFQNASELDLQFNLPFPLAEPMQVDPLWGGVDNGLLWILQDTAVDIPRMGLDDIPTNESGITADAGFSFLDALTQPFQQQHHHHHQQQHHASASVAPAAPVMPSLASSTSPASATSSSKHAWPAYTGPPSPPNGPDNTDADGVQGDNWRELRAVWAAKGREARGEGLSEWDCYLPLGYFRRDRDTVDPSSTPALPKPKHPAQPTDGAGNRDVIPHLWGWTFQDTPWARNARDFFQQPKPLPTTSVKQAANYQPRLRRPYVPGTEGTIVEVLDDPALDPVLAQFRFLWLDAKTYESVKASLKLAQYVPGHDPGAFRMPESLYTVNTLVSVYALHFYNQLPVVHLPTFNISKAPPLLVAAILCIGATLSKLPGTRPFAVDLLEMIRRAVYALFEMDSVNLRSLDLVHVCMATTFMGLWSGHQRSYELAEITRGMLVQLVRKTNLLNTPVDVKHLYANMPGTVHERWQWWITLESRKRLGIGVFIIDSLFPVFLDTPSYLSRSEMLNTALPCDENLWRAQTAEEWASLLNGELLPPPKYYTRGMTGIVIPPYRLSNPPPPLQPMNSWGALVLITGIHHHLWDYRAQVSVYQSVEADTKAGDQDVSIGVEQGMMSLGHALELWRREYYDLPEGGPLLRAGRLLYHLGHIALRTNIRDLYTVAGKNGTDSTHAVVPALRRWVASRESPIAVSHAIKVLVECGVPEPTDNRYAPPAVFVAILAIWVFIKFNGIDLHQFDPTELISVFGECMPTQPQGYNVLRGGMKYLISCKEWKMSAAFALVLAKILDDEEASTRVAGRM